MDAQNEHLTAISIVISNLKSQEAPESLSQQMYLGLFSTSAASKQIRRNINKSWEPLINV